MKIFPPVFTRHYVLKLTPRLSASLFIIPQQFCPQQCEFVRKPRIVRSFFGIFDCASQNQQLNGRAINSSISVAIILYAKSVRLHVVWSVVNTTDCKKNGRIPRKVEFVSDVGRLWFGLLNSIGKKSDFFGR